MGVEEVAAMPSLTRSYGRALRNGLRRRASRGALPGIELVVAGVPVDRRRLADYDRVCGFALTDALPGTYPHVLAFPLAMELMSQPDFPLPLVGLVQVANRIDVLGPLPASERFEVRVRAEDLREHDRGRQVDLVAELRLGHRCVWRGRSTFLHRQRRPPSTAATHAGPATRAPSADPAGRQREPVGPAAEPTGRQTEPNGALWRVPRDAGRRYAAVSGDRNPIHTSRLAARAFGFSRPIAHGMWTTARCLAALANRLPEEYTVEIEFKRPILLPSVVGFTAERVASPGPAAGGWRLAVRSARTGRTHVFGQITGAPHDPITPTTG